MQEKQCCEERKKRNEKNNINVEKKKIKISFCNIAELDNNDAQF